MGLGTTTTWTGASSSAFDTAGNWTNGVPVQTGAGVGTAVIDGAVSITGGKPTNHELDNIFIAPSYTGAIGSSGTPLELDFKQLSVDNNTSGSTHYIDKQDSTNTATVTIDGLKTGNALYLSGTIDTIIVESSFVGTVVLGNSASFVAEPKHLVMLSSSGTVDATSTANVEWVNSATVIVGGGTLKLGENIGQDSTLTQSTGIVTVSDWTVETGDTFNLLGGTLNWNAGSTGIGNVTTQTTVTNLNVYGGTVTTAANEYAYVGFEYINQYGGAINLASSFPNAVFTNTFSSYGGTFTPSKQVAFTQTAK